MKKGKKPVICIRDDDSTTDHSEEEVEVNNGEMMNAPEEKATSDAVKLAKSKAAKRRQANLDSAKKSREKKEKYITSLEKETENLRYSISTETTNINRHMRKREGLLIETQIWSTRLQSLNQRYIQSSEEYRRLQQELKDLENLQQEQSRAPNAAQDPNSMLEPQQIQTSGPSHQQAHQPGGPHNAAHYSYGTMVPQQIQTSGPSHQQAHQPGEPHNAAHHSYGIMVPQQIQTSGPSHQQAHQPGEPHNAAHHSYGIMVPQQIQTSGPSHQQAHQPGGARYIMRQEAATWEGAHATRDQQVDAAGWLGNDAAGGDVPGPGHE